MSDTSANRTSCATFANRISCDTCANRPSCDICADRASRDTCADRPSRDTSADRTWCDACAGEGQQEAAAGLEGSAGSGQWPQCGHSLQWCWWLCHRNSGEAAASQGACSLFFPMHTLSHPGRPNNPYCVPSPPPPPLSPAPAPVPSACLSIALVHFYALLKLFHTCMGMVPWPLFARPISENHRQTSRSFHTGRKGA